MWRFITLCSEIDVIHVVHCEFLHHIGLNGAVSGNGKAKSASSGASSTSSSPSPAYTTSEQTNAFKAGLNAQNKPAILNHCKTEQLATNPPNWSRKQKIKEDQAQEKASHKTKEVC